MTDIKAAVRPRAPTGPALAHVCASLPQARSSVDRRSYEDLGQRVGPGAADVALCGVERHVVDGLLELLAVSGELLDARLALHVPQADGAVVTWQEEQRQPIRAEVGVSCHDVTRGESRVSHEAVHCQ